MEDTETEVEETEVEEFDPNSIMDDLTPSFGSQNTFPEPDDTRTSKKSKVPSEEPEEEVDAEEEDDDEESELEETPKVNQTKEVKQLREKLEAQERIARQYQSTHDRLIAWNEKNVKLIEKLEARLNEIEDREEQSVLESMSDSDVMTVGEFKKMQELQEARRQKQSQRTQGQEQQGEQGDERMQQARRELQEVNNHPAANDVAEFMKTYDITKDPAIQAIPEYNIKERFNEVRIRMAEMKAKETAKKLKVKNRSKAPPTGGIPSVGQRRTPGGRSILDAKDLPEKDPRSRMRSLLA